MKWWKVYFSLIVLVITLLALACNKDKEQVAELEKEVINAESQLAVPDSMGKTDSVAAQASEGASTEEYARTPDEVPSETPQEQVPSIPTEAASPRSGFYTLQVASSTDRQFSESLAEKYRQRGYEAFVTSANIEGIEYFRVRIGNYESSAQAQRVGSELQDKYSAHYWIARHTQ